MTPIGVRTSAVVSARWVVAALAGALGLGTALFFLFPAWLSPPRATGNKKARWRTATRERGRQTTGRRLSLSQKKQPQQSRDAITHAPSSTTKTRVGV